MKLWIREPVRVRVRVRVFLDAIELLRSEGGELTAFSGLGEKLSASS